jgi:hypothetical protein
MRDAAARRQPVGTTADRPIRTADDPDAGGCAMSEAQIRE